MPASSKMIVRDVLYKQFIFCPYALIYGALLVLGDNCRREVSFSDLRRTYPYSKKTFRSEVRTTVGIRDSYEGKYLSPLMIWS